MTNNPIDKFKKINAEQSQHIMNVLVSEFNTFASNVLSRLSVDNYAKFMDEVEFADAKPHEEVTKLRELIIQQKNNPLDERGNVVVKATSIDENISYWEFKGI